MVAQLSQPVGSAKNTKGTENMTKVTQKIIKITFIGQCMMNIYHEDNTIAFCWKPPKIRFCCVQCNSEVYDMRSNAVMLFSLVFL